MGRSVDAGNDLILEEIHEPGGGVPLRMAPLILVTTVITHLFGGSAGREGTAVQLGGGLAGGLVHHIPWLDRHDIPTVLLAGVAAGFGGVFGTPVAGMIFALEVLAIGRMRYGAILPCLVASLTADWTCTAWGISHTPYHVASLLPEGSTAMLPPLDPVLLVWAALGGVAFGLAGRLFAAVTHGVQIVFKGGFTADGFGFAGGFDQALIAPMRRVEHPRTGVFAEVFNQQGGIAVGEFADGAYAQRFQLRRCLGADAVDLARGQRPDACGYVVKTQHGDTAGLVQIGGDFRQQLVGRDTDGARQPRGLAHGGL